MDWVPLIGIATGILVPSVTGLILWNWSLTKGITELRVTIAAHYHTKQELQTIMDKALAPLIEKLDGVVAELREARRDPRDGRYPFPAREHGRD